MVAELAALEPGELTARLTSTVLHRSRVATPLRRDERPEILYRALGRHLGHAPPPEDRDPEERG